MSPAMSLAGAGGGGWPGGGGGGWRGGGGADDGARARCFGHGGGPARPPAGRLPAGPGLSRRAGGAAGGPGRGGGGRPGPARLPAARAGPGRRGGAPDAR